MDGPRLQRGDALALAVVLLIALSGALFYPVSFALDPAEAMRAAWLADARYDDLYRGASGEPVWSDGRGGALPPGYPHQLPDFEERLGGYPGRRTGKVAPDERHPALPSVPPDAWGNPYWLTVAWGRQTWGIASAGPDRAIDTSDDVQLFEWDLQSWSKYHGLRVDLLLYIGAGLFAWLYVVLRALGLPRASLRWEVARAVVLVTPLFAVVGCCVGNSSLSVPQWSDLQLAPAWLSAAVTLSGGLAAAIVWWRLRGRE